MINGACCYSRFRAERWLCRDLRASSVDLSQHHWLRGWFIVDIYAEFSLSSFVLFEVTHESRRAILLDKSINSFPILKQDYAFFERNTALWCNWVLNDPLFWLKHRKQLDFVLISYENKIRVIVLKSNFGNFDCFSFQTFSFIYSKWFSQKKKQIDWTGIFVMTLKLKLKWKNH